MVILEFLPDPPVVQGALSTDLAAMHALTVRLSEFVLPVRLNVGSVELFAYGPELSYLHAALPVLDFAAWGLKQVKLARIIGTAVYKPPDSWAELRFDVDGADVIVHYSGSRRTGRATYRELLDAWERFVREVRAYLGREATGLARHPFWGAWLRGADFEQLRLPPGPEQAGETLLEFQPDDAVLDRCRGEEYWARDPGRSFEDALAIPLRLVVGGVELLPGDWDGDPIVPAVPLLSAAAHGLAELQRAHRFGRGRFDLPSVPDSPLFIWFELTQGDLLAYFNISKAAGQASYSEVEAVWVRFIERVREYLIGAAPELLGRRVVGSWLTAGDATQIPPNG